MGNVLGETWKYAERLSLKKRDSTLLLCRQMDSLAQRCPETFADYLVAANALACNQFTTYREWGYYLGKAEQLLARYEPYLHYKFLLRTKIMVAYERCRFTDSQGDLEGALACYQMVWNALPVEHPDSILPKFRFAVPNSIAWVYQLAGDYKKALYWLLPAELNLDTTEDLYPGLLYNLKGKIHQSLGLFGEAERDFRRSEKEYAKSVSGRTSNHFFENYMDFSNLFLQQSLPDSALAVLARALTYEKRQDRSNLYLHNQLAGTYLALDSIEQALSYWRLARQDAEKLKSGPYYWKGRILSAMGEALARQKNWSEALDTLQLALLHLSSDLLGPGWDQNPDPGASDRKLDLLKVLVLKAGILENWYESAPTASVQPLEWSLNTALTAVDLVKILRAGYGDDEVKEYLSQQSFSLFEQALDVAARLYRLTGEAVYLEQAFALSETSKALSLLENLKDMEAKAFADLPDSLIHEETKLKIQVARLERQISESSSDSRKLELRELLFQVRNEYGKLLTVFQERYPDYYALKYETQTIPVSVLQGKLGTDETLVEYFFGERQIFVFAITRSEASIRSLPVTEAFMNDIETFLQAVSSRRGLTTLKKIAEYQQTGYRIYRHIFEPVAIHTRNLLVIPDGKLNYLPFAALPTNTNPCDDPGKLPYLIHRHVICNDFSASVHFQQQKSGDLRRKEFGTPLLILSPKEFPNDSRLSLDSAQLASLFHGQVRIIRDPSKEQTRQLLAEGFANIFLFTHAAAGENDPFFQLYNDTLYLRELYATPVYANLVLLGACETGLGKNQRGEGVLSLARGFAYQNVPNTIMSLWKVQEGAALKISLEFLRLYLQENLSPGEALRQAQLHFLADPEEIGFPFLWAGFIGVGE